MAHLSRKLFLLCGLLAFSSVWAKSKAGCPVGFTLMGDKCYYVSSEKANWFNADRKCFNLSASLLIFDDETEMQVLTNNLKVLGFNFEENNIEDSIWTGISSLGSGDEFASHRNGGNVAYTPWCADQPSKGGSKDCVAYANLGDYGYHNIECTSEFAFVCETKKYNTETYMCLKQEQFLEVDLEV